MILRLLSGLTLALSPAVAFACPDCAVGRAARAQVLGPELLTNLAVAILPFAIVALVCLRVERL